ncbi:MAG: 16S rRNA (cytosine(1402)-N(4))-methyltransferase RsmH [Planctomycetes bacterium]|nr:16S rRNA (cytosine(1402)-N(4))-methyltransferase RsmH [Planctomycetota bacterium]
MTNAAPGRAAGALHRPVLVRETIQALAPRAGAWLLDGTEGLGGHSVAWLDATVAAGGVGRVVGIDRDGDALAAARVRLDAAFPGRSHLHHGSYEEAVDAVAAAGAPSVDAALLDLGASSLQLDAAARGFSFQVPGPLDMRMDGTGAGDTAADLVNHASETELARIFTDLGEEPAAVRIARAIVADRSKAPFRDTLRLAESVARATGGRHGRLHPATRVFQALRIAVNDELGRLRRGLPAVTSAVRAGGRIGVISFHRLEDREVKRFFEAAQSCGALRVLGDVAPTQDEVRSNPRSRSARLRWAERLDAPLGEAA